MKKLLVGTLTVATVIMLIMAPFGFGNLDVSLHLSKILRVEYGEYFLDPFSGLQSLYPSFFHFLWGSINRLTHFDPYTLAKLIAISGFWGVFIGSYLLAKTILKSTSYACVATLCVALVLYLPTGRYVLQPEPYNFSIFFLILGITLVYRYCQSEKRKIVKLLAGLFILGFSVNLWWYHGILVSSFLIGVLIFLHKQSALKSHHILLGGLCFFFPFSFLVAHIYSIRSTLNSYIENKDTIVNTLDWSSVKSGLFILLTKGNAIAKSYLLPYAHISVISVIQSLIFYGIYMPLNLLLLGGGTIEIFRKRTPSKEVALKRILLYTAFVTFFISIVTLVVQNDGARVRRIHFTGFILLLIYCFSFFVEGKNRYPAFIKKQWNRLICTLALIASLATITTCFYTTKSMYYAGEEKIIPQSRREAISYLKSHTPSNDERVFLFDESLREIAPFVHINSFLAIIDRANILQDPKNVRHIISAYLILTAHSNEQEWKKVVSTFKVKYLVFNCTKGTEEREAADYYAQHGRIVFSNETWRIIEPN